MINNNDRQQELYPVTTTDSSSLNANRVVCECRHNRHEVFLLRHNVDAQRAPERCPLRNRSHLHLLDLLLQAFPLAQRHHFLSTSDWLAAATGGC